MRLWYRQTSNSAFTAFSYMSVILLALMLMIVLIPLLYRGSSAVLFTGTVEYRQWQLDRHNRGNEQKLQAAVHRCQKARQPIYDLIDHFSRGIDTSAMVSQARSIYRQYGQELHFNDVDKEKYTQLRQQAKDLRNLLCQAYQGTNKIDVLNQLDQVLESENDPTFQNTAIAEYFEMAQDYKRVVEQIDLEDRDTYAAELQEVKELITLLFGPRPDQDTPALEQERYGATRWDMVERFYFRLMNDQTWVQVTPDAPLEKKMTPRVDNFAGTDLAALFPMVENNLESFFEPRFTCYWQYFLDDSSPGHYFGGVGPEILGTLLITILAMAFAIPLGIVSAGYLVECAGDTLIVKIIRTCINTLAGVPSIVFGLFGMAFFILFLLPKFNLESKGCILTAAMTLSVLVLPVIIRASEEAIRTVPRAYKEASLALGAGPFRTFMTVTLPSALPGILTGVILSISRAAGETAPIMFTGAVALGPIPKSIFSPTRALSYGSYDIAVGDRVAMLVPHQQYGMVMTLILLVLILNIIAIVMRSRISKKLQGF